MLSEETLERGERERVLETPCGPIAYGLENVIVKVTSISDIDGERGILWYRGYRIDELARHSTYEETAYLLLYGRLPSRRELEDFRGRLLASMELSPVTVSILRELAGVHPMFAMESALAAEGAFDSENQRLSEALKQGKYSAAEMKLAIKVAERLIAKLPIIVAWHYRLSRRLDVIKPREDLSYAANILYVMSGREPDPIMTRGMDLFLVLHADHEIPASTFAALVTASTFSDMYSVIVTALAALKGPLHGGANEAALANYMRVGDPAKAKDVVEAAAKPKGPRLAGVGHRVYRTYDPRAAILREFFTREFLPKFGDPDGLFSIASAIEREVLNHPYFQQRRLYPNVDFWSGILLHYMGVPREYFTPMFAVSRVAGWLAHALEYWKNNRILRPRACYVGPRDLRYVLIDER